MKDLEFSPFQTFISTPSVGKYEYGVFNISYSHVAKIMSRPTLSSLIYQFNIQKKLYDLGIQVPKPEGVYNVKIFGEDFYGRLIDQVFPAFIMEKIFFCSLNNLSDKDKSIFFNRADEQIKLAEKYGFVPGDLNNENRLWDFGNQKAYLIDFEYWKHPDIPKNS